MRTEQQKNCVCDWKTWNRSLGGGLNLHVFTVNGTNVIREVPQDRKIIHDLRLGCPYRGWRNFMF